MNQVNKIIGYAEQRVQSHGARLTTKRKQVLAALLRSGKALSAYELVDLCKTNGKAALPAMSVYRILDFLRSKQLVHKLSLTNKYVACAHIACGHARSMSQFLICDKCQKVTEVNLNPNTLAELQNNLKEAGFQMTSPQLEFNCICQNCQQTAA